MISERFKEYVKEHLISDPDEREELYRALETPLPKTIRIRPDKQEEVHLRLESIGYVLGETSIENGFTIER